MKYKGDKYLETVDRVEPDILPLDLTDSATSMAVSLKRIADVFERLEGHINEAIENDKRINPDYWQGNT